MNNTFVVDKNTGMTIQELRNGFLGREVTYFLINSNNKIIASSTDRKNWTMFTWIDNMKPANKDEVLNILFPSKNRQTVVEVKA